MRILFLDDMEVRHTTARAAAEAHGHEMISAYTAEDAIGWLEREAFDVAFLDHDLADEHYSAPYASPSTGGTAHSGRAVARWIAEHGTPPIVVIHSFNPDGARAMAETLAGKCVLIRNPFGPQMLQAIFTKLSAAKPVSTSEGD